MKTILWAFKDRLRPTPVVHLFLVTQDVNVSPIAGCGMQRRSDDRMHVVTLMDRRLGLDLQLCATCARHAKLDPSFVRVQVKTLVEDHDYLRWNVPAATHRRREP